MPVFTNLFKNAFGSAPINYASDTIKVMLLTSAYTPDKNAQAFKSDLANEVTGTGYTAGGQALASKTIAAASGVTTLSAANADWASSTITARYAVLYKDTGTATSSPLIGWLDFGSNQSSSNADFIIQWSSSGILQLTAN